MAHIRIHSIIVVAALIAVGVSIAALLRSDRIARSAATEELTQQMRDLRDIQEELTQVQHNVGRLASAITRIESSLRLTAFNDVHAPRPRAEAVEDVIDTPKEETDATDVDTSAQAISVDDTTDTEVLAHVEEGDIAGDVQQEKTTDTLFDEFLARMTHVEDSILSLSETTDVAESVHEHVSDSAIDIEGLTDMVERAVQDATAPRVDTSARAVRRTETRRTGASGARQSVVFRETSSGTEIREIVPTGPRRRPEDDEEVAPSDPETPRGDGLFIPVTDLVATGATPHVVDHTVTDAPSFADMPVSIPVSTDQESATDVPESPPTVRIPEPDRTPAAREIRADETLPGARPVTTTYVRTFAEQAEPPVEEPEVSDDEIREAETRLVSPERVTSVPSRTVEPEADRVEIRPSRLAREREEREASPAFMGVSDTLIRSQRTRERRTMSDILEEHARKEERRNQ